MRQKILSEIDAERDYQDRKWGRSFDDCNTVNDWSSYISKYASNATFAPNNDPDKQRKAMVQVAALAVAALEAFDRNNGFPPRHYDMKGTV